MLSYGSLCITSLHIVQALCTCTSVCILLSECVQYSVFTCNVFSQMGAQQGVAGGPSPGSEMLIMNINKSYTHSAHTHIPTLITASARLAKQEFHFPYESTKKPGITIPPGQHLVSLVVFFILLCCSAWKINFNHLLSALISAFSVFSFSLAPPRSLFSSRGLSSTHQGPLSFLRVGLLSREWNAEDCGSFFCSF